MSRSRIRSGLLSVALLAGTAGTFAAERRVVRLDADTAVLEKTVALEVGVPMNRGIENERVAATSRQRKFVPCIYDMPYSITANYPHYKELWQNTAVLFGAGFVTLGVLELLPENATAWNKAEVHKRPVFDRWWHNVKSGPVWDKDNLMFNYVLHPYGGAVYYMSARSQGFNMFYSFLYGLGVSTFFWEYGIEAFMEIPSIQDLFVTPIGGILIGETFYRVKRYIVEHDYCLSGSKFLGTFVAFLVDPVNEVVNLVRGNPARGYSNHHQPRLGGGIACYPWLRPSGGSVGQAMGFTMSLTF